MANFIKGARIAFKMAKPLATAGATAYGAYNASHTEQTAHEIRERTAAFDPHSNNLHERAQAQMAKHLSEDTSTSALHNFAQRFDPDKLALPRSKALENLKTTVDYLHTTDEADMRADALSAGKKAVMHKAEKLSELPGAVMKAGDMAVKTGLGELRGEHDATRQTLNALVENKKVVAAKQAAMGLGIASTLSAIPHPAAKVAGMVMTAQTLGRLGHEANEVSDLLSRDKGAVLSTMEQRVELSRSSKAAKTGDSGPEK